MKKRLLMMALTMVTGVGAFAYNAGDYIYTMTAKYKAIENNLVQNGAFSEGVGGLEGWTNEAGGELNSAAWEVTTNAKDGLAALSSVSAAADGENVGVMRAWTGMSGIYAISFWIKANEATVSAVTAGNTNYIDFFVNATGVADKTDSRQVAEAFSFNNEWTQVVDTVEMHEGDYLVFVASKVSEGTQMTDFQINKVNSVYDTRVVDRLIAYAEKLLAEPDLPEGKDDFGGLIGMMKDAVQDPTQNESAAAMEALVEQFNGVFDEYMNSNGGNMNAGDWSTVPSYNWNNINNSNFCGSYWTIGDRWGFSSMGVDRGKKWNDAGAEYVGYLERPENDGFVATAGLQRGQNQEGSVRGVKVKNDLWEPGKYFFAIEAQAVNAATTGGDANGWKYGSDHVTRVWEGPSMFIGSDTLVMRPATEAEIEAANPHYRYQETPDTLNGYYWKRYYMIGEVKAGETVEAGFLFPPYYTGGFKVSVRNPEFRMIGKTETQLKYEEAVKKVIVQQTELKNRLTNYPADVADYNWEKDSLDRAIANAQPVLDGSYAKVDAEGNCSVAVSAEGVDELAALESELLAHVNAMNSAKNWIVNSNKPVATLKESIASATAILNDEVNKNADATARADFDAAIKSGQALVDNISAVNQSEEFNAAIANISDTQLKFTASTASKTNPSEQAVINPFFAINKGQKSRVAEGWTITGQTDNGTWKFVSGLAGFENNTLISFDRGNTAYSQNKVQQTIKVTFPGTYEFVCQAYAYNNAKSKNDLLFDAETGEPKSGCRVFFGLDGAPDSLTVVTDSVWNQNAQELQAVASENRNGNVYTNSDNTSYQYSCPWPDTYVITYDKKTEGEEVLEFGFDTMDNGKPTGTGACNAGFGGVHVRYCGPTDAYVTGIYEKPVELLTAPNAVYTIGGIMVQSANLKPGMYIKDGKVFVVK